MSATIVGRPVPRIDGPLKVTGRATFAAEFQRPKLAYGALIQSTIANGRVASIDLSHVKSATGVIGILTRENAPRFKPYPDNLTKNGAPGESRVPLQDANVYWVGQHLGVVVAETFEQATHAASLVRVQYEANPPLVSLADANRVRPEKFIGRDKSYRQNAAMRVARLRTLSIKLTSFIQRQSKITTLSRRLRRLSNGRRPTDCSSMRCHPRIKQLQKIVAECVRITAGKCAYRLQIRRRRVWLERISMEPNLARSSGGTTCSSTGEIHIHAVADADLPGQPPIPNNTFSSRRGRRRKTFCIMSRNDHPLLARFRIHRAVWRQSAHVVPCSNVEASHQLVRLNLTTPCPMRATGEAPGVFALECALDELAHKADIDPVEFRLRNYAELDEYRKQTLVE